MLTKLGSLLVSGCADGVLKMWDLDDGQLSDTKVEPGGPRITALQGVGPFMVRVEVQTGCWSKRGRERSLQQGRWKARLAASPQLAAQCHCSCDCKCQRQSQRRLLTVYSPPDFKTWQVTSSVLTKPQLCFQCSGGGRQPRWHRHHP